MNEINDWKRTLVESHELLGDLIEGSLLDRGWRIKRLDAGSDEPLEWFWPPTAPHGYGGHDLRDDRRRALPSSPPPTTPWRQPTRLKQTADGWTVCFGEADHAPAAPSEHYASPSALKDELARIEWWPMDPQEAQQLQHNRILTVVHAWATNTFYQACTITEPYASRLRAIDSREKSAQRAREGDVGSSAPPAENALPAHWAGGIPMAQRLLVDAEAWVSAQRTARVARGDG